MDGKREKMLRGKGEGCEGGRRIEIAVEYGSYLWCDMRMLRRRW